MSEHVSFQFSAAVSGESGEGERQRARLLQAASLSTAQLEQVSNFVVDYLGDRLDQATSGRVLVHHMDNQVKVDIEGACSVVLPAITLITAGLYELLEAELGFPFAQNTPPA